MGNRKFRRGLKKNLKRLEREFGIVVVRDDPRNEKLKNVADNYIDFIAPPAFQRPKSWTPRLKKNYFESILMNRIEGSIILVNIGLALRAIKKKSASLSNDYYKYFHKCIDLFESCLDQGKKYIVLDGNNRLSFIIDLLTGQYSIPEGTYHYIADKNDTTTSVFKVTRKSNTFDKLSPEVQNAIWSRIQVITEYTQIDWLGMSDVFINTNTMMSPNAQELRNALVSDWCDFVVKIRELNINLLGMMMKEPMNRLSGDDWIAKTLTFLIAGVEDTENLINFERKINQGKDSQREISVYVNCHAVNENSTDKLYESEFIDLDEQDHYLSLFANLSSWISKLCDLTKDPKERKFIKSKSLIQNFAWLLDNGIETYEEFLNAYELYRKAYADGNTTYGEDEATFKNACSGLGMANVEFRYIILSEIISKATNMDEIVASLEASLEQ